MSDDITAVLASRITTGYRWMEWSAQFHLQVPGGAGRPQRFTNLNTPKFRLRQRTSVGMSLVIQVSRLFQQAR